jgi:hypothetical protein
MRVGHLAKGLLLRGDTNVELVVLCADKPTLALLRKVVDLLPPALKQVAPENTYTVTINAAEAGLTVAGDGLTVLVQLTSPIMREQGNERNGRTSRCECGVYSTVAGFKLTCSMQSLIFLYCGIFFLLCAICSVSVGLVFLILYAKKMASLELLLVTRFGDTRGVSSWKK